MIPPIGHQGKPHGLGVLSVGIQGARYRPVEKNKAAERNMIARRLRQARSGCERQYPARYA
jgi:hypothetical protein